MHLSSIAGFREDFRLSSHMGKGTRQVQAHVEKKGTRKIKTRMTAAENKQRKSKPKNITNQLLPSLINNLGAL